MSSASRICRSCKTPLPPEAAFCLKCGKQISGSGDDVPSDPLRASLERAIGSQYQLVRLLGRGGMGAVYLAREPALDRAVAIKVLPPEASDSSSRERFRREARTAAKLTHPNIVPLHTFGEADGMMYFVMGYVQGESLADRLRREGQLSPDEARRLLAQIADALDYAHRQGVVHRDIKPDNILLDDSSGKPMLTDFGVAKASVGGETLTAVGTALGTPHYMSPEQASGERDLDGRSDLYSLGVMGYQMLTGQLPFEGESFREIIVQHMTKEPTPIKSVAPGVPDDVALTLDRCLAKDPEARWPDAATFKNQLALDPLADDELPFHLARLEGAPVHSALFALGASAIIWRRDLPEALSEGAPLWEVAIAGFGAALFLLLAWLGPLTAMARSKGHGWSDIVQALRRPPGWWPFLWPSRWRRPSDLWDRLPLVLKRARTLNTVGVALMVPVIAVQIMWAGNDQLREIIPMPLDLVGIGIVFLPVIVSIVLADRWGKRMGYDSMAESGMVALNKSTGNITFWKNPRYSRILLPPSEERADSARSEPQTPQAYLRAVLDTVKELDEAAREIASDAADVGRQLMDSIQAVEREIQRLSRDADPSEIAKLEQKLQALGDPVAGEPDEERELRALTQTQLELTRRLAGRLYAAKDRHAKLVGLLKTLWLQIADLRAQSAREAFDSGEVSGKIRALCDEIEGYVAATEETARMLTPSAKP